MPKLVYFFLLILVALIPFENLAVIPGLTTLARTVGLIAFAVGLLAVVTTRSIARLPVAIVPVFLFVAWSSLSLAWTMAPESTEQRAFTYWLLLTFLWLIWQYVTTLKEQQTMLRVFLVSVAFVLLILYYNYMSGTDVTTEERYAAAGLNLNSLGLILVTTMNLIFYFLSRRTQVRRGLMNGILWAYFVMAAIGTLLTGSRAAIIGLIVCITLTLMTVHRVGRKAAAMFFVCAIAGLILIPRLVPSNTFARFAEGRQAQTYQTRTEIWKHGISAWCQTPFVGVGAGAYRTADASVGGLGAVCPQHVCQRACRERSDRFHLLHDILRHVIANGVAHALGREDSLAEDTRLLPSALMSGSEEYSKVTWLFFALILRQSATLSSQSRLQRQSYGAAPRLRPLGYRNPRPGPT